MVDQRFIVTAILTSLCLSGCSSLSKQERATIAQAKNACSYVDVNKKQLTLKLMPVINGKELPTVAAQLGKNSKADLVIYQTLWHQDVCIIQRLAPKMPFGAVTEWDQQISAAFVGVPQVLTGTYADKIRQIHAARDKHLEELKTKSTTREAHVRFEVFAEAIPQDDFLKVTTLHSEITFPENYLIKGTNVAKSVVSGDLAPGEFSEEIRPALQVIRSNLGAYAEGRATEREVLVASVSSIYDAAANKVRTSSGTSSETATSSAEQTKEPAPNPAVDSKKPEVSQPDASKTASAGG